LLGHTNITQTRHYYEQLRILRNIFKFEQVNESIIAQSIEEEEEEEEEEGGMRRSHGQFALV